MEIKSTRYGFGMIFAKFLAATLFLCILGGRPEGVCVQAADDCLSGTHSWRKENGTHVQSAEVDSVNFLNETRCLQKHEENNVTCLNGTHPRRAKLARVYVEENGTDVEACLEGIHPCKTFGYAVRVFHSPFSQVGGTFIFVNYSHNFTVNTNKTVLQVSRLYNIYIQSGTNSVVTLTCPDLGTGLAFTSCHNINIWKFKWINCAIQHHTTVHSGTKIVQAYSSLFFLQCSGVLVWGCTFTSNRGNGISVYDGVGDIAINIANTSFTNISITKELQCNDSLSDPNCSPQSTGLYIESTLCGGFEACVQSPPPPPCLYNVSNCIFEGNSNLYPSSGPELSIPFGKGGGMGVSLLGNVNNQNITIINSQFTRNKAHIRGGGISILIYGKGTGTYITVADVHFNNNTSGAGGGMSLGLVANTSANISDSVIGTVQLTSCNFVKNFASMWGGGMNLFTNGVQGNKEPFKLTMQYCTWDNNSVKGSAAALGVTHWEMQQGGKVPTPLCTGCLFMFNHIQLDTNMGSGVVYLQEVPMIFQDSLFENNSESGLYIDRTTAHFQGSISFWENSALSGGGIHLFGNSWIVLYPKLSLKFIQNTAFLLGGAIYNTFPQSQSLNNPQTCFLQYESPGQPLSKWNVSVLFSNNSASQAGDAIYLSTPVECKWEEEGNPFQENSTQFTYQQNWTREVIATPAANITPQLQKDDNFYQLNVTPGKLFSINFITVDYFNQNATAVMSLKCLNEKEFLKYNFSHDLCDHSPFYIEKSHRVALVGSSLSGIYVAGPQHEKFVLLLKSKDLQPVQVPILVHTTGCPLGFVSEENECTCPTDNSDYVRCIGPEHNKTICIQRGYWFGALNSNDPANGTHACLFGHLCSDSKLQCGDLSTDAWVVMPSYPSGFCQDHRTGVLCTLCDVKYTLSYDSYNCVKCTTARMIALALSFLGYWLGVLLFIILVIKLDISLGIGYAYGILFYFSSVRYVLWHTVPTYLESEIVMNVFETFAKLDPRFFIYTKFCLFPDVTSIQYEALHYIHPLVIILSILGLIAFGRKFPRVALLSGNTAVHALCYLFLLAYTTLAETSLNLLLPLMFEPYGHTDEPQHTYVQIQPGTIYLDYNEHLPYMILAVLVEVVIVIPFALFLLFAPCLVRFVNLIKLKPILDEYQSYYRDQYRWFPAVYLIGRHLIFVTHFGEVPQNLSILLTQTVSVSILLLHASLRPYRSMVLNVVDTILLLDLNLLTYLFNSNDFDDQWFSQLKKVLIVVLLLIPSLYTIFAVFRKAAVRAGHAFKCKTAQRWGDVEGSFPPDLREEEENTRAWRPDTCTGVETTPLLHGSIQTEQ